jgi:hypothetical protein
MKNVILCLLVMALALASTAADDIAGEYTGFGIQPYSGVRYACKVDITQTGDVYRIRWTFDDDYAYEGVGIVKDGRLCVGYGAHIGYGVALYEIGPDGVLDGALGLPGFKEIGTEKLHKD